MRREELLGQVATPLGTSAYPWPPYRFTDREYLNILYRTDTEAAKALVPEPLVVEDPLVRFEVMAMPDVSGLGAYTECGQALQVTYDGEQGEYMHAMYVDNHAAIASGREFGAFPKKLGAPHLFVDSDTLVGTLDYGSIRVATATMGYKHWALPEDAARSEITTPTYMVKMVRGSAGAPRILELVRTQITDVTIKGAWSGPARLQLFAHALAPLADLPVREVISVSHILTDLSLAPGEVVHDYLADADADAETEGPDAP
jgi:acetoacetate decarboxylase